MNRRRRATAVIAAVLAVTVTLAGCNPPPEGRVVDRDRRLVTGRTVHWRYWLTTEHNGVRTRGIVSRSVYRRCQVGDYYPACAER